MGRCDRVVAIWLDGYSFDLAAQMLAVGELPVLAGLRRDASRWRLDDHGTRRTGLAGEHLSSGLDPDRAQRWAAVHFDPATYEVRQVGRVAPTVYRDLPIRTVVLDTTYFDLAPGSNVSGITGWGAHDAGGAPESVPTTLGDEARARVGAYPADRFVYCTPWSSPDLCAEAGAALGGAVDRRADLATWLLGERLPDWDLAIIGVSEAHSAIEALWHGVDAAHPLADHPSAPSAGDSLRHVYRRIDALVGSLATRFPDATLAVFSLHGMGPNRSDVASMAALGDLLALRAGVWRTPAKDPGWERRADGLPLVDESHRWSRVMGAYDGASQHARWLGHMAAGRAGSLARRAVGRPTTPADASAALHWIPATRHRPRWPSMDAFALPSFYDGRIRVNLAGRERRGIVPPEGYTDLLDDLEKLLRECRDPLTGEPVVDRIERPLAHDPDRGASDVGVSASDLVVVWRGVVTGLHHPALGRVGPYPLRRTGGHSVGDGELLIRSPHDAAGADTGGLRPVGDLGSASSFDVVPTLLRLAGCDASLAVSGKPLIGVRSA